MTSRKPDWPPRKRRELDHDRADRGLLTAADALRTLNARAADDRRNRTRPVGQSDPRYSYLTQSHD